MPLLYKYLRHSDDIAKQPHSREAQMNAIERFIEYAKHNDRQIAACQDAGEFWDADISGGMPIAKRPAGGAVMGRVAKGDIIIAAAWDRMFRDALDGLQTLQYLEKVGVRLICLDFQVDTSTAMGKFAATILIGKGELERNQTSERIKDRLKVLKHNRGVAVAYGRPFGWKRVRTHEQTKKNGAHYTRLVPDRDERMECERIRTLHEGKKMGWSHIAVFFNNNNRKMVRSPEKSWNGRSVKQRYEAIKAGYPCKDFDHVTGQNSEQLMVPVEVEEEAASPCRPSSPRSVVGD